MSQPPQGESTKRNNSGGRVTFALVAILIAVTAYYTLVAVPKRHQLLRTIELKNAGLQYHEFYVVHSRPPQNLAEFMEYEPAGLYSVNRPRELTKFAAKVREGKIIVLWGSKFLASGWENDQHALAYESVVPESGGLVLMLGGSVNMIHG